MQTIPASVQLGFVYVGATGIGLRTVRLDKTTVVSGFTTVGVAEAPANSGQFQRAGGIQAHDEGGYLVWGTSGTDVLWDGILPASSTTIDQQDIIDALTTYDVATADDLNCAGDGKIEFTYTLTSTATGQPIPGATIRITSDIAGLNTLWTGTTDVLGVARNLCGDKPRLVAGTVYIWRSGLSSFQFTNPDVEVPSA